MTRSRGRGSRQPGGGGGRGREKGGGEGGGGEGREGGGGGEGGGGRGGGGGEGGGGGGEGGGGGRGGERRVVGKTDLQTVPPQLSGLGVELEDAEAKDARHRREIDWVPDTEESGA